MPSWRCSPMCNVKEVQAGCQLPISADSCRTWGRRLRLARCATHAGGADLSDASLLNASGLDTHRGSNQPAVSAMATFNARLALQRAPATAALPQAPRARLIARRPASAVQPWVARVRQAAALCASTRRPPSSPHPRSAEAPATHWQVRVRRLSLLPFHCRRAPPAALRLPGPRRSPRPGASPPWSC